MLVVTSGGLHTGPRGGLPGSEVLDGKGTGGDRLVTHNESSWLRQGFISPPSAAAVTMCRVVVNAVGLFFPSYVVSYAAFSEIGYGGSRLQDYNMLVSPLIYK